MANGFEAPALDVVGAPLLGSVLDVPRASPSAPRSCSRHEQQTIGPRQETTCSVSGLHLGGASSLLGQSCASAVESERHGWLDVGQRARATLVANSDARGVTAASSAKRAAAALSVRPRARRSSSSAPRIAA